MPRTWCLEPDFEGRGNDPAEIYWGYALTEDPGQGPLNVQANRVMVIEKKAYDALVAAIETALTIPDRWVAHDILKAALKDATAQQETQE